MSEDRQITLSELLQDPVYAQWFNRQPPAEPYARWRVYVKVKRKAPWQKRDFKTWAKAHKFVLKYHERWYDCVLICRNQAYMPPIVKVQGKREYYHPMVSLLGHRWCTYCRRPTIFGYFKNHHAFSTTRPLPWRRRCSICGIAEEAIKHY